MYGCLQIFWKFMVALKFVDIFQNLWILFQIIDDLHHIYGCLQSAP